MPGVKLSDPIAETVAALEHTLAGPLLAVALASLDLASLTGSQCVDVLKARYRQDSHERGQLFAVIAEVMHRSDAESAAFEEWLGEFAADEVRAALVLTRRAADDLCLLAEDVVRRLPTVQQAFAAGVIDQPRARVFSAWTAGLCTEHTQAIVAALLPRAHQLTTAQLIHEIQRHAIALDPHWARRRYEKALQGRRVVGSRNSDGTANLTGYDLPVDQVAAACDRLDRLAKAAKAAGHRDPIDHVRAGLFLGMTDGTYAGLTDPQILARLLAEADLTESAEAEPAAEDQPPNDQRAPDEPAAGGQRADDEPADDEPADDEPADDEPDGSGDPGHGEGDPARGGAVGRTSAGSRLLVGLATLAGADLRPGELIGWGPVHPELARAIAAAPGASWWYVLTGAGGAPLAIGPVRSRPSGTVRPGRGFPGPQVWIQVNQATLNSLARRSHPPGWDRVIAEITVKSETCPGPPNGDPTRRLPGAALRRWIHVRDRTCVFPGCRVPAHRADADHTVEHGNGGPTIDTNLGPGCRHDHRLRHHGGWTLTHTKPGHFTWTSRLGHTYHRRPPPDLDDLPESMPPPARGDTEDDADAEFAYLSTQDWRYDQCMQPEPLRPPAQPPPPPPPPGDDTPPF